MYDLYSEEQPWKSDNVICFFPFPNTELSYTRLIEAQYHMMDLIELAPVSLETKEHLHNFQIPGSHH